MIKVTSMYYNDNDLSFEFPKRGVVVYGASLRTVYVPTRVDSFLICDLRLNTYKLMLKPVNFIFNHSNMTVAVKINRLQTT